MSSRFLPILFDFALLCMSKRLSYIRRLAALLPRRSASAEDARVLEVCLAKKVRLTTEFYNLSWLTGECGAAHKENLFKLPSMEASRSEIGAGDRENGELPECLLLDCLLSGCLLIECLLSAFRSSERKRWSYRLQLEPVAYAKGGG